MKIGSGAGSLAELFEGTKIRSGTQVLGSVGEENTKGVGAMRLQEKPSTDSGDAVTISSAGREAAAGAATVYTQGLKKTEAQKEQEEEQSAPESVEEIQKKMDEVQQQIQEAQQELQAAMSQAGGASEEGGNSAKVETANQKVQQLQTQLQQLQTQLMQAMEGASEA